MARCKNKNKKDMRYNAEWLLECLLLRIKSSKTYEHLRSEGILPLPHKTTLQSMLSGMSCHFGFNEFALKALEKIFDGKPLNERFCSLMWDEITIAPDLTFNSSTFKFDGFMPKIEDLIYDNVESDSTVEDELSTPKLIDHALVFVVRPYIGSWVLPFAVFPAKNAVSGRDLYKMVMRALIVLEEKGARVLSTVCDGAATNVAVWNACRIFGRTQGNKYMSNKMVHPTQWDTPVYFLRDAPHLMKTMRNHLFTHHTVQVWLLFLPSLKHSSCWI